MTRKTHPILPDFPILPTTVVGSYPMLPLSGSLMDSFYKKTDPYRKSIENCVREQTNAGIHVISDGQTRADMINIFASKLSGIRMKGKAVVSREIRFNEPITIRDQKFAVKFIEKLHEKIEEKPKLKGIVTGPHTMANSVRDEYYKDKKELSFAFAEALNKEARALQEIVPIIQFDEPFLSVEFPEYAVELVKELVKGIKIPVSVHVCGDVSDIFSELIEMPVTVLDHEFSVNPGLINTVKDYDFNRMLGFGAVRSDENRVESVGEITEILKGAADTFGVEKLMVDPDCGLKHLDREIAFGKLKNLREARDRIVKEV